ncbi:MAG: sigma-70 family RNA polymerase sigma factor [Prevotellaceae bacterium]|jgi:RNA polymerase sigma-70 factor (ECF subfamily)|nr:sigma-70 family RNA polymerase sigma factor [Prevotellaceae bacterium]
MNTKQFNNKILKLADNAYRLAKSILNSEFEAQDAVQDLNLKLWEKRNELDKIENITGFVLRSMRNLCLDKLRQKYIENELSDTLEYSEADPHSKLEKKDMATQVTILINRLPELQRTIIRMRDVEGMEFDEIAEITSLTENAIRVNLSRARQKIREQLITN